MSMYVHSFPVDNRQIVSAVELTPDQVRQFFRDLIPSDHHGRLPLMEAKLNGMICVMRRFHHGGLLGSLLGYRYWESRPRAVEELNVLSKCCGEGLPVVKPFFAWVEGSMIGYRQGLVTAREEHARDLLACDALDPDQLARLVETLERFFSKGLHHPDLNIKNILFDEREGRFILLDFDRARLTGTPTRERARRKIYRRLMRSFDKRGRWDVWSSADLSCLPDHVQQAFQSYRRVRPIRALFWKLR